MNEPNKFSKYKKTIIRRGILVWIPTLLSAGSLLLFRFDWSPFPQRHMSDFMRGFQAGMVLGLLGCGLLALISTILTCRNPEKLRKAYVEETDERTQLISRKAFSVVGWALFFVLPPAVITASFFSNAIYLTLLAIMLFFIVVLMISLVYYKRKL